MRQICSSGFSIYSIQDQSSTQLMFWVAKTKLQLPLHWKRFMMDRQQCDFKLKGAGTAFYARDGAILFYSWWHYYGFSNGLNRKLRKF
jgi:hypothetical protein